MTLLYVNYKHGDYGKMNSLDYLILFTYKYYSKDNNFHFKINKLGELFAFCCKFSSCTIVQMRNEKQIAA